MITTTAWVPRGFAAPFPNKYKFDEEEYERIAALAKLQLGDAEEDLAEAQEAEKKGSEKSDKKKAERETKDDDASEYVSLGFHGCALSNSLNLASRSTMI